MFGAVQVLLQCFVRVQSMFGHCLTHYNRMFEGIEGDMEFIGNFCPGLARTEPIRRICRVKQDHTFLGIYGVHTVFSKEITIHTVIYGADVWSWPTLGICVGVSQVRYL